MWHHERHALIRPANLIAKSDEEAESMQAVIEAKTAAGGSPDELELDLDDIALEALHEREKRLVASIKEHKHKKGQLFDAVEWSVAHGDMETAEYVPTMKWESKEITPQQLKALKRARIDPATVTGRGHASALLSTYFATKPLVLASPAQREIMKRAGCPNADTATDAEAREFFANRRKR